MNKILKHRGDF